MPKDGGPAFLPVSLRDYFAAAALQGILATQAATGNTLSVSVLAFQSYATADAMLAERERKPE